MHVVVCGGTGSLGQVLVRRLLGGELGPITRLTVFSRDEAKQHTMRLAYEHRTVSTDEIIYESYRRVLRFQIGDVRDLRAVRYAIRDAQIVFYAAALKQVPTCEYFPLEAVQTNILGAANVIEAVSQTSSVERVVGISTDKACLPINVMGMTKALQERVFIEANLRLPAIRFLAVRYGNVLASRGSVIPLFQAQIAAGGPVTVTTPDMTRFFLSLDKAVETLLVAAASGRAGDIFVPHCVSARMVDVATALMGDRAIPITYTGIRPGEKTHEMLISREEAPRVERRGAWYAIRPCLPELHDAKISPLKALQDGYSSATAPMTREEVGAFLRLHELCSPRAAA